MTEVTSLPYATQRADDVRLVAGVSARRISSAISTCWCCRRCSPSCGPTTAVSYTELGLALTVFNAVSAVAQTPAGFLIDRINARLALVVGLLIGASGFAVAAIVDSYWVLVAMFGLIGLGNTVYHPADYALLSRHVAPARMSQAYSVHTFAGMLGIAAAPGAVLLMHGLFGWRGAFAGAAILGALVALVLMFQPDPRTAHPLSKPRETHATPNSWRLLLAPPILVNFLFFSVYAFASFGLQNFSVVALGTLYGTDPVAANAALAGNLLMSAFGVLVGGYLAGRVTHHRLIAGLGLSSTALVAILIGELRPQRGAAVRRDVGGRPSLRHGDAVARHDRARGDAARRIRQGVWPS